MDYRCLILLPLCLLVIIQGEADIRLPPSIYTQVGTDTIIYRSDGVLKMPCQATGIDEPSYEWYKNDAPLNINLPNIHVSADVMDGTITIDPATALDEGKYQCFAKNLYGTSMSNYAELRRANLGSVPDQTEKIFTANEGDSLRVPCEAVKSYPQATFSWVVASSKTDTSSKPISQDRRVMQDEEGNLFFAHVEQADQQNDWLYKCNIFNSFLDFTFGGSYSKIEVIPRNAPNRGPSLLYKSGPTLTALVGQESLGLKCLFSAKPAAQVTWQKIGAQLPRGRHNYMNSDTELQITSIQIQDEGEYMCRGSAAGAILEERIQVTVQAAPEFTQGPVNVNKTVGETATFTCRAFAIPNGQVTWYNNGDEIDPKFPGPRMQVSANLDQLTISDLCKDCDDGSSDLKNIQCKVSNVHGTAIMDAYLNVLLPTVLDVFTPEKDFEMKYYEDMVFSAEAHADDSTPVRFVWYKDNVQIQTDKKVSVTDNIGAPGEPSYSTLRIITEDDDDGGKARSGGYTVVVTNGYSDVNMTVYATEPAGVMPVKAAGIFDLWWIFLVIALILLLIILCCCCCLCCRKNRKHPYPVDEKERKNGNNPEQELKDHGFSDYKRPEDEPMKGSRASLTSTIKLDSDDDDDLNEYGDIDAGKFNEDGSFIGQYLEDNKQKKRRNDTNV